MLIRANSPRQQQVLDFILAHIREHGVSPTVREISRGVGIGSPNGVQCHLAALVKKGQLRHQPGASRSYVPTAVVHHMATCPFCKQEFSLQTDQQTSL